MGLLQSVVPFQALPNISPSQKSHLQFDNLAVARNQFAVVVNDVSRYAAHMP